jgi:hypothetical protein
VRIDPSPVGHLDAQRDVLGAALDLEAGRTSDDVDHQHRFGREENLVRVEPRQVHAGPLLDHRQAVRLQPRQHLGAILVFQHRRREQLRDAEHRRNRRADLVAHVAEEDVLRVARALGGGRALFLRLDDAGGRPAELADEDVDAVGDRVELVVPLGDDETLLEIAGGHHLENLQELGDTRAVQR